MSFKRAIVFVGFAVLVTGVGLAVWNRAARRFPMVGQFLG